MPTQTTRLPLTVSQDLNDLAAELKTNRSALLRVIIVRGIAELHPCPR